MIAYKEEIPVNCRVIDCADTGTHTVVSTFLTRGPYCELHADDLLTALNEQTAQKEPTK